MEGGEDGLVLVAQVFPCRFLLGAPDGPQPRLLILAPLFPQPVLQPVRQGTQDLQALQLFIPRLEPLVFLAALFAFLGLRRTDAGRACQHQPPEQRRIFRRKPDCDAAAEGVGDHITGREVQLLQDLVQTGGIFRYAPGLRRPSAFAEAPVFWLRDTIPRR